MKNLLKYLSVFAIAGSLGLQTLNVSAATTCEAGEKVHTNYYLFLDVNSAEFYDTGISGTPEGTTFTLWNGAYKYNNIQKATIVGEGQVSIMKSSETTDPDASKSWTAVDYWKKYYTATENRDSNLVYTKGDESYFLHDKWWTYEEKYTNGVEKSHANTNRASALSDYLEGNWNNLATSSLVTYGTSLPLSKVEAPSNLSTSEDTTLMWHISRRFANKDILDGVRINNELVVYSPAVYYVEFCVEGEEKAVTYDANTTDAVTNLPGKDVFEEECTEISSTTPVRSGWTFLGWSENKNATEADPDYAPGEEYCGDSIMLYAIWKQNTPVSGNYTITYDANGGKDAPASQTGKVGECQTISSAKPTLEGNNFLGWSTKKDATEPDSNYDGGDQYCGANGDITLYAVWQTQTGVSAHLVAFSIVAIAAGTAFIIAKKKDLFKQI